MTWLCTLLLIYQRKVYHVCAAVAIPLCKLGKDSSRDMAKQHFWHCVVSVVEEWQWCLGRTQGTALTTGRWGGRRHTAGSLDSCRPIAAETSEWHTAGRGGRAAARWCFRQTSPSGFPHTVKSLDDRRQGLQVTGGPWAVYTTHQWTIQGKPGWAERQAKMKQSKSRMFFFSSQTRRLWRYRVGLCLLTNNQIFIGCIDAM